jgi:hypothetical protein
VWNKSHLLLTCAVPLQSTNWRTLLSHTNIQRDSPRTAYRDERCKRVCLTRAPAKSVYVGQLNRCAEQVAVLWRRSSICITNVIDRSRSLETTEICFMNCRLAARGYRLVRMKKTTINAVISTCGERDCRQIRKTEWMNETVFWLGLVWSLGCVRKSYGITADFFEDDVLDDNMRGCDRYCKPVWVHCRLYAGQAPYAPS